MENCKICDSGLITYNQGGIEIQICKKCQAVVISKDNFEKLAKHINPDCEIIDLFGCREFSAAEDKRICGNCNKDMEKIYFNGVVIDRCKSCELLVFDDGELSKYFSKYSPSGHEIINNAKFIKTYFPSGKQTAVKHTTEITEKGYQNMQIQSKEEEFKAFYAPGILMLFLALMLGILALVLFVIPFTSIFGVIFGVAALFILFGFRIIKPQEAMVLTLFGKYAGSIKEAGFHWVNPFTSSFNGFEGFTVSLKARTLDNGKQKINDEQGNPIEVGIMVTWEIKDTAKAIFNVRDLYTKFH